MFGPIRGFFFFTQNCPVGGSSLSGHTQTMSRASESLEMGLEAAVAFRVWKGIPGRRQIDESIWKLRALVKILRYRHDFAPGIGDKGRKFAQSYVLPCPIHSFSTNGSSTSSISFQKNSRRELEVHCKSALQ